MVKDSSDPVASPGPISIPSMTPKASTRVPLPKVRVHKTVDLLDPFSLVYKINSFEIRTFYVCVNMLVCTCTAPGTTKPWLKTFAGGSFPCCDADTYKKEEYSCGLKHRKFFNPLILPEIS